MVTKNKKIVKNIEAKAKEIVKDDSISKINTINEKFEEKDNTVNVEVYDEADLAFVAETRFLSAALEAQKIKMQPQKHPDFDGVHCIDCDDEIPAKRLEMQRIRCVACQTRLDKLEARKY